MLTSSVLDAAEVEAERGVILEEIAMTEDDPGDCVHDLFARALLGDSPLGRPVLGTVETVNGFTRDRLRALLPQALRPAAPGRGRRRQPRPRHGREPGACAPSTGRARWSVPSGREPVAPRSGVRPACVPGAASRSSTAATEQAHLVLGMPGYSRNDDRRWALGVLNAALGGGMSSRLFQEVREKRGLAY